MTQLTHSFYPFAGGLSVFEDFTPASRPEEELYWDVLSRDSGDHSAMSVLHAGQLGRRQGRAQIAQRTE